MVFSNSSIFPGPVFTKIAQENARVKHKMSLRNLLDQEKWLSQALFYRKCLSQALFLRKCLSQALFLRNCQSQAHFLLEKRPFFKHKFSFYLECLSNNQNCNKLLYYTKYVSTNFLNILNIHKLYSFKELVIE